MTIGSPSGLAKAVRAEVAADLLIVEDDPAQGFQPIVFAARQEFS
jgi:hypothetical protein